MNFLNYIYSIALAAVVSLAGCELPASLSPQPAAPDYQANPDLQGGPMPVREARMVASRCVAALPDDTDAALRTAFESAVIHLLADRNPANRTAAARQLGEFRQPAAAQALRLGLREDAPQVRAASADALGLARDRTTAVPLANALSDPHTPVRLAAATALGRIGNPHAVDALADALKEDADATVRSAAARSLGQLRDKRATAALAAALKDATPAVRSAAAGALGLLNDSAAVQPLITALADPSPIVRYQAANALGATAASSQTAQAAAALKRLSNSDPDPAVRNAAHSATKRLQNLQK